MFHMALIVRIIIFLLSALHNETFVRCTMTTTRLPPPPQKAVCEEMKRLPIFDSPI
jgi:hypothetical protein